jgi:hypothetical protein
MGVLDDAIREHLDLKRSRGADPTEVERLEREALGPVRRDPVRGGLQFGDPSGSALADESAEDPTTHPEYHDSTAPHWQGDHFEEHLDPANGFAEHLEEAAEPPQPKRRGFLRRRGNSARERKPTVEPGHFWPEHHDEADHFEPENYEADHFPSGHFEPEDLEADHHEVQAAYIGDGAELPHDDGPMTELHQVVDLEPLAHPLDEPSDDAPATQEEPASLVEPAPVPEVESPPIEPEPEPELEHPLGPLEPVATDPPAPESAASSPGVEPPAPERRTSSPAIAAEPRGPSATPPPLAFENPPRRPRFTTEPPGLESSVPASPGGDPRPSRDELQRTSEFDVQEHLEDEELSEDVLEETPEFLQDTPEHDRLWFEQRPPRDFDFDG